LRIGVSPGHTSQTMYWRKGEDKGKDLSDKEKNRRGPKKEKITPLTPGKNVFKIKK